MAKAGHIWMIENEVLGRIRELLEWNKWTIYKLAKASGIPYSSLNNCFLRNTYPTIPTLEKLCIGLNISLSDFFDFKKNPLRDASVCEDEQNLLNAYVPHDFVCQRQGAAQRLSGRLKQEKKITAPINKKTGAPARRSCPF